jgi:hypothetical protein
MTTADIEELYQRCIECDDRGEYKNIEARQQLADIAGSLRGLSWGLDGCHGRNKSWYGLTDKDVLWQVLYTINSINLVEMSVRTERPCITVVYAGGVGILELEYTNPADRAAAECAARVFANIKAKEASNG